MHGRQVIIVSPTEFGIFNGWENGVTDIGINQINILIGFYDFFYNKCLLFLKLINPT